MYLREHNFINDHSFAESFIQARIRHGDGPMKIKQMLMQKGIQRGLTDDLLSQHYPAELQIDNVVALLKKRMAVVRPSRPSNSRPPRRTRRNKERDKLYRFVASRGYTSYVIIRAFEEIHRGER